MEALRGNMAAGQSAVSTTTKSRNSSAVVPALGLETQNLRSYWQRLWDSETFNKEGRKENGREERQGC